MDADVPDHIRDQLACHDEQLSELSAWRHAHQAHATAAEADIRERLEEVRTTLRAQDSKRETQFGELTVRVAQTDQRVAVLGAKVAAWAAIAAFVASMLGEVLMKKVAGE